MSNELDHDRDHVFVDDSDDEDHVFVVVDDDDYDDIFWQVRRPWPFGPMQENSRQASHQGRGWTYDSVQR